MAVRTDSNSVMINIATIMAVTVDDVLTILAMAAATPDPSPMLGSDMPVRPRKAWKLIGTTV